MVCMKMMNERSDIICNPALLRSSRQHRPSPTPIVTQPPTQTFSGVRGAGTRDEPLRSSALEANRNQRFLSPHMTRMQQLITNDKQILHTSVARSLLQSSSLRLLPLKFIEADVFTNIATLSLRFKVYRYAYVKCPLCYVATCLRLVSI